MGLDSGRFENKEAGQNSESCLKCVLGMLSRYPWFWTVDLLAISQVALEIPLHFKIHLQQGRAGADQETQVQKPLEVC